MALPSLKHSKHKCTLPISGREVSYRPFLVGEEKLLLMAAESKKPEDMIEALKNIATSCVDNLDVDTVPLVDLEYLFIKLRIVSKGESSEIMFKCKNDHNGEECGNVNQIQVDLNKAKVENKDTSNVIPLVAGLNLIMKTPDFSSFSAVAEGNDVESLFKFISSMVESIVDGDEVYTRADATDEEFYDFLLDLTEEQFNRVQDYFRLLPKVVIPVDYKCTKCGIEKHFDFKGVNNFFVSA